MFGGLVTLKTKMVDPALMLFAAFYGLRTLEDAKWVIGVAAARDRRGQPRDARATSVGLVHLGMKVGERGPEAGRMFGAFGHANDTGTLIVTMLPGMIAMMVTSQRHRRASGVGAMLVSALVLILTVSRGAFVGLFLGTAIGGVHAPAGTCRCKGSVVGRGRDRRHGVRRARSRGSWTQQIGNTISERLFGQSKSIDMSEASSGRTQIWAELLDRMARTPLSLLTGFG